MIRNKPKITKSQIKYDFLVRLQKFMEFATLSEFGGEEVYIAKTSDLPKDWKTRFTKFPTIQYSKILPKSLFHKQNGCHLIEKNILLECLEFYHKHYSFKFIEEITKIPYNKFETKIKNSKFIDEIKKQNVIFMLTAIDKTQILNKNSGEDSMREINFHDINTLFNLINNLTAYLKFVEEGRIEYKIAVLKNNQIHENINTLKLLINDNNFKPSSKFSDKFKTFRNLIVHHSQYKINKNDENYFFITEFLSDMNNIYIKISEVCEDKSSINNVYLLKIETSNLNGIVAEILKSVYANL